MSHDEHASYPVGYGKPPLNTRWRKGQSGNLEGRPKASGLRSAFVKAATAANDDADLRYLKGANQIEALMTLAFRRALRGDPRYAKLILQLGQLYLGEEEETFLPRAAGEEDPR